MKSKEKRDFIDSLNRTILMAFPKSRAVRKTEYLPKLESYENAIASWEMTRGYLTDGYWRQWIKTFPNFFNADHMTLFLYLLSFEEARIGRIDSADRIAYLNRIRHGINVWHTVLLPTRLLFVHSTGTVLGRAKYSERFVCYQNVSIGASRGKYPVFLGSCVVYSGSSVLGNCEIGNNVVIGAGTLLIDQVIPANSKVFRKGGKICITPLNEDIAAEFFQD
jgi:serine O-acetyltransferase